MIRITNLHKRFNTGTPNEVYALRGIDLHIKEGEFVTVIGTNGSGKSTLLNVTAGSFLPDSGKITIDDQEVTRKCDYQRAKLNRDNFGESCEVLDHPWILPAANPGKPNRICEMMQGNYRLDSAFAQGF